jgi:uncharacterized protein YerC
MNELDFTAKDRRDIATLYREGYSYRQIAAAYGVSHVTIGKIVVGEGITPRKHGQFELILTKEK